MLNVFVKGFTLEFCFEPNDYFSNTILTKQYFLRFQVDNAVPLLFEGPEVYKSIGLATLCSSVCECKEFARSSV